MEEQQKPAIDRRAILEMKIWLNLIRVSKLITEQILSVMNTTGINSAGVRFMVLKFRMPKMLRPEAKINMAPMMDISG